MRSYDLDSLLRSTIGFDRFGRVIDQLSRGDNSASSYPPYNIEKYGEDKYRITMAVAGFGEEDLDITITDNSLVIKGEHVAPGDDVTYLHHGIAGRAFERRFELAETIKVTGANLEKGLLQIDLVREVPEHKRPRKIEVRSLGETKTIESEAA